MIVTDNPDEFRALMDEARRAGKQVGFHPTMGALHGGHRSNIRQAAAECDVVAVSIFVNPLQFGAGEDFGSYPRDLDADVAQAQDAGAAVVFAPPNRAMFPEPPLITVAVRELADTLEGSSRPGHFEGVATIVAKLLNIVGPCRAYFGEKDFQQLVVVRRVVSDLSLPTVVVGCPTVREPDGLALSSRNSYLSDAERQVAPVLYWALLAGKRSIEEEATRLPAEVRAAMLEVARRQQAFQVDYAEVVDPGTLRVPEVIAASVRLVIAGRLGPARLIDNLAANGEED